MTMSPLDVTAWTLANLGPGGAFESYNKKDGGYTAKNLKSVMAVQGFLPVGVTPEATANTSVSNANLSPDQIREKEAMDLVYGTHTAGVPFGGNLKPYGTDLATLNRMFAEMSPEEQRQATRWTGMPSQDLINSWKNGTPATTAPAAASGLSPQTEAMGKQMMAEHATAAAAKNPEMLSMIQSMQSDNDAAQLAKNLKNQQGASTPKGTAKRVRNGKPGGSFDPLYRPVVNATKKRDAEIAKEKAQQQQSAQTASSGDSGSNNSSLMALLGAALLGYGAYRGYRAL